MLLTPAEGSDAFVFRRESWTQWLRLGHGNPESEDRGGTAFPPCFHQYGETVNSMGPGIKKPGRGVPLGSCCLCYILQVTYYPGPFSLISLERLRVIPIL